MLIRWLSRLYNYLDVGHTPHFTDLLIVLGGHRYRAATAAELYQAGYAARILIGGSVENVEQSYETLVTRQIPRSAITMMPHTTNTWDEGRLNLDYMRMEGLRSALLITTRPHTRRTKAVYRKLNTSDQFHLTVVAALYDSQDASNWWKHSGMRYFVFKEYSKMIFYLFRYGVWSWE